MLRLHSSSLTWGPRVSENAAWRVAGEMMAGNPIVHTPSRMTPSWLGDALRSETIADRYDRIQGFTTGFDYLRLILAAGIVLSHGFMVTRGQPWMDAMWGGPQRVLLEPLLLMFFGLSGFLVTGSLKKNPTATSFLTLRALRLLPALAVEIVLSALVLGPIVTDIPLSSYFSSPLFYRYFLNILGYVQFVLPGTFTHQPIFTVNNNLWTIPYELECYFALVLAYLLGMIRRPRVFLSFVAIVICVFTANSLRHYSAYNAHHAIARALVVAFLVGVVLNLFAHRVKLSGSLAAFALVALVLTAISYRTAYLTAVPAAYLVVFAGMANPPKRTVLFKGDYSYGLYLFGFPIQQTFVWLAPQWSTWWSVTAVGLIGGLLYAALSWTFIEKPVLSRKGAIVRRVEKFRDRLLRRTGIWSHGHAKVAAERIG